MIPPLFPSGWEMFGQAFPRAPSSQARQCLGQCLGAPWLEKIDENIVYCMVLQITNSKRCGDIPSGKLT